MVLIDYCGNSFSVWVLWKALLIMKTMDRLKTLYWPTLKACWMIWPAVMVSEITINMTGPGARFSKVLVTFRARNQKLKWKYKE